MSVIPVKLVLDSDRGTGIQKSQEEQLDPRVGPEDDKVEDSGLARMTNKKIMKDQTLKFICFFLIISSFVYVFVGISGVNLPAYYPVLHKWSITPIKDAISMGFYGRVAFTLIFSLLATLATILFTKNNDTKEETLIGFTKAAVIFGVLFFVAEEWHKWGIEKMKFDTKNFLNYEFWFFLAVSLIALSAACLATGNCRRKNR